MHCATSVSYTHLVEIVNVEGAGGANGVNYAYKQPADGYTYMLGTQSLIMLDLQKILPMDFKAEFIPVSKLCLLYTSRCV